MPDPNQGKGHHSYPDKCKCRCPHFIQNGYCFHKTHISCSAFPIVTLHDKQTDELQQIGKTVKEIATRHYKNEQRQELNEIIAQTKKILGS